MSVAVKVDLMSKTATVTGAHEDVLGHGVHDTKPWADSMDGVWCLVCGQGLSVLDVEDAR